MKIDNKIANYEISQQITKSAQNINEGQQLSDGQRNQEIKSESRDAIVNLSQASKDLRLANEALASAPDVREDKVTEIRNKIESGTYEIDNQAVADKMVGSFIDELF
jgi:negative regulator of flagellin synthesis FlgM